MLSEWVDNMGVNIMVDTVVKKVVIYMLVLR